LFSVPESDISFSKFPVTRRLLKLFYDENTQFFYLLCSQFRQKTSGWINKTLLLIKQHITYMNLSRYANIDKFVNIRYIFLLARRAYSWLFQLAQMWKLLALGVGLGDLLTPSLERNWNQRLSGVCHRSPGSKLLSITTQLHCSGHLGGRAWLPDTILEEDHPMTIPSKLGSNWATGSRQDGFYVNFP
jgi:hypothetical protein